LATEVVWAAAAAGATGEEEEEEEEEREEEEEDALLWRGYDRWEGDEVSRSVLLLM
jgi:hypothetical protein